MKRIPQFDDFSALVAGISKQTLTWDFSSNITPGQTLQGAPTVTVTVVDGTDTNAQGNITAGPAIGTANLTPVIQGATNCAVLAQFTAPAPGSPGSVIKYKLTVSCAVTPNALGVSDIVGGFDYIEVVTPG